MGKKEIRKIVYFDKETIQNILQEQNHGEVAKRTDLSSTLQTEGEIETSTDTKVKLDVPFFLRLAFLFSGRLSASFIVKRDSMTTISSTEISEFEKLKPLLTHLPNIQLHDIENSSTSLRVAAGYLKIMKGGVEGVDTKEFKAVMDSYDGYDTYSVSETTYVRFNNTAFVSNYKRNDLLTTTMTLYCIPVGEFEKERFDFIKEMNKMETLVSTANQSQSLADAFPPAEKYKRVLSIPKEKQTTLEAPDRTDNVKLYDVIYACVSAEEKNE